MSTLRGEALPFGRVRFKKVVPKKTRPVSSKTAAQETSFLMLIAGALLLCVVLAVSFASHSPRPLLSLSSKSPYKDRLTLFPERTSRVGATLPQCSLLFVNHLGRHGTRFPSSRKRAETVFKMLLQANQANALLVPDTLEWTRTLSRLRTYDLTEEGKREHTALGHRARKDFSATNRSFALFESTFQARALESRSAFVKGFVDGFPVLTKKLLPAPARCTEFLPSQALTRLRFYKNCPAFQSELARVKKARSWAAQLDALSSDAEKMAADVVEKLFSVHYAEKMTHRERVSLVADMWFLCQSEVDVMGTRDQWCSLLPFGVQQALARAQGQFKMDEVKLWRGVACPLFEDWVATTDSATVDSPSRPGGVYRFAHLETLLPLLEHLPIELPRWKGGDEPFRLASVGPMAANLQMFLYKCKDDFTVRVLVNEQDVRWTLDECVTTSSEPPFLCPWRVVRKAFWGEGGAPLDWRMRLGESRLDDSEKATDCTVREESFVLEQKKEFRCSELTAAEWWALCTQRKPMN